jgi:threonine/homoserine/homoserine lactone efflux protein
MLLGIVLGLSLAAPPGPVNVVIASESTRSRLHGFTVGLGAATADFTFFILIFFFASIIPEAIINYLYLAGGLLMLYMAYAVSKSRAGTRKPNGNYFVGFFMAITSPFNLSWWITAGLFMLKNFSAYSVIGLFVGILIWVFTFSTIVFKLRKNIDSGIIRYISSAILVLFGAFMLYESIILIIL